MSNAVSALQGAAYEGLVTVTEAGLRGMVTLKGDLGAMAAAVKTVTGQPMPEARRIVEGDVSVAWMASDEVLILCDHARANAIVAELEEALKGTHFLAVNVSDARTVFEITGEGTKDSLGKVTPADLGALAPLEVRRSRLAQIAGAFWIDGQGKATVICFRSVGKYAFDLLSRAAAPGGEVGFH